MKQMMIHPQKMSNIRLDLESFAKTTEESIKTFNEYIKRALEAFNLNYQYQRKYFLQALTDLYSCKSEKDIKNIEASVKLGRPVNLFLPERKVDLSSLYGIQSKKFYLIDEIPDETTYRKMMFGNDYTIVSGGTTDSMYPANYRLIEPDISRHPIMKEMIQESKSRFQLYKNISINEEELHCIVKNTVKPLIKKQKDW